MEYIMIAIVTEDRAFGKALGVALVHAYRNFSITLYNKMQFLERRSCFCEQSQGGMFAEQYDLILWDEDEIETICSRNLIQLVDKASLYRKNRQEKQLRMYKFSPAAHMTADLLEWYELLTGRYPAVVPKESVRFLAFGASSGGTGCTTLAMAVGQELSRFQEKKVLYLSLEDIESTGNYMQLQNRKTVGQYLYDLFKPQSREGVAKVREEAWRYHVPFLEGYLLQDEYNLEAFAPTRGRNPLCQLDRKELCAFIGSLMESGRYDVIVADLGCSLSDGALACIEMAECFCMVHAEGLGSVREAQYLQYLISHCGERVMEHCIKVHNMSKGDEASVIKQAAGFVETELHVAKGVRYLQEGDMHKILLEGEFGQSIHELTARMTEPAPQNTPS